MDKKKLKALLMAKGFGVEGAEIAINAIWEYIQKSQAEAIKEFADKLKQKAKPFLAADILGTDDVDDVVKETVGDSNES